MLSHVKMSVVRLTALLGMLGVPLVLVGMSGKHPPEERSGAPRTSAAPVTPEVINLQESFVRIAEQVTPAVVNISTVHVEKFAAPQYEFYFGSPFEDFFGDFFGGPRERQEPQRPRHFQRKYEGTGTGVIIDADGYILTNEHVVRDAKEIEVTVAEENRYRGKVVGKDARSDLAVIKIDAGRRLPFAKLGDSDRIRVGEWAIAIGSPFGLQETVTTGIISAVRQSLSIEGQDYRDLIQTDAAINRGNSGGPLCNIRGEIIGINTAIYAPTGVFSGVGFAIPVNNAKEILNDLIHRGRVVRGWVGVDIREVDAAVAKQFRLPDTAGALVNSIVARSPAARAGLKRGDVIREFGGERIVDVRALQRLAGRVDPGERTRVKIVRDSRDMTLYVVIGEMPADAEKTFPPRENGSVVPQRGTVFEWEGMRLANIDTSARGAARIRNDEKGVLVVDLMPGTLAGEIGLMPGDIVRSVNRTPTPTVDAFARIMKQTGFWDGLVFDVDRQGKLFYLSYSQGNNGR